MAAFKRRQIVMLSLVLMVVAAGYLSYSSKKSSSMLSESKASKVGEAVFVGNDKVTTNNSEEKKNEEKDVENSVKGTQWLDMASKEANDFFSRTKLERETRVSKDSDSLKSLSQDTNISKEAKDKAYDQMIKVVQTSQREVKIEALIKEKGFKDVVVLCGDDGSMDIVVKAPTLNSTLTAQIADIASRQGNLPMNKIHVRNIY
jgi:stage III sporulation protein AH